MSKSGMMALAAVTTLALVGCGGKKTEGGGDKAPATDGSASTPPSGGNAGVIKIWSSLPRTGSANAQTTTIVNGIRLAIEDVGGKIGDFQIIYEDKDDASAKKGDWDPEVEAANADNAVKDPDVMAYIGTYNSGAAKISMPVLNKAGL